MLEKKSAEMGVKFRYYFIGHKTMHEKPLDINGRQNIKENLSICHKFNTCVQLIGGIMNTDFGIEWRVSKKELTEWI